MNVRKDFYPGNNIQSAMWAAFDADWYVGRYLRATGPADPLAHYLTVGAAAGHSPNPFFDETWYRLRHRDVMVAIARGEVASGFAHYCANPENERSPHWLFDAPYHLAEIDGDTRDFVNAYDHFLQSGDCAGQRPSIFFHAPTVLAGLSKVEQQRAMRVGCFRYVVSRIPASGPEARFSPYFDPAWYLRQNPSAASAILRHRVPSALAHYLLHRYETQLDPVEMFSERYYLAQHADVASAVSQGIYACGYAHFLDYGIAEGRRFHSDPALSRDLAAAAAVRKRDGMPDAFARLLMFGSAQAPGLAEADTKQLFRDKARHSARSAAREIMDFTCDDAPAVTVIMVLHNKLELTLAVLHELQEHMPGRLELILVNSGSSDETNVVETYLSGARVFHFEENINFVRACNIGLKEARGQAVLYLNNDIRLGPRAVQRAFSRLMSASDIGAVGGMVIRSHGLLQEAGCIIWRDGFTDGYLRDASPLVPEANFVRDVDFCSGAFLMVRRALALELNGFDVVYSPAYFEETDFCVRLRQRGRRVVYDPGVRIEHLEYGSAAAAQDAVSRIATNQRIFAARHADWLLDQPDRTANCTAMARNARETWHKKRILLIEDRLPLRALGSGFVRSNDILQVMAELGYTVTVYPIYPSQHEPPVSLRDFPETFELITDRGVEELEEFLADRSGYYDYIWIGRTHNLDRLASFLTSLRGKGGPKVILDTEAIASVRTEQEAGFRGQTIDLLENVRQEFRNIALVDRVVTVNDADARLLTRAELPTPAVLGHMRTVRRDGPGFDMRRDLLFVGAMHRNDSPNREALQWFVEHVLVHVVSALGEDIRLTVIGHLGPEVDLSCFAEHRNLRILGSVPDLRPSYDSHRIFVAPTRIAGGAPYKLHEAASEGIPIVATELLASQLEWVPERDLLAAPGTDAVTLAAMISRLYLDRELWDFLRTSALNRVAQENSAVAYAQAIKRILDFNA